MLWIEYWANSGNVAAEDDEDDNKPKNILRTVKTNLPPISHPTPSELRRFLNAVESEISDPEGRSTFRPNLPPDEAKALLELVKLQKRHSEFFAFANFH